MYCSHCDVLMGDSHTYCYACGAKKPEEEVEGYHYDHEIDVLEEKTLYNQVKGYVIESGRTTKTALSKRFYIKKSYASELLDILEADGIVGKINSKGVRDVIEI